jgi:hypothetical protein
MFTKLREVLPANRVAFILGLVGVVTTALVTFQTSLVPGSPAEESIGKALIILASVYKGITLVEKFLDGSQNMDSLIVAGVPKEPGVVAKEATPQTIEDLMAAVQVVLANEQAAKGIKFMGSSGGHSTVVHNFADKDRVAGFDAPPESQSEVEMHPGEADEGEEPSREGMKPEVREEADRSI